MRRAAADARYIYRERFLWEKYGMTAQDAGAVDAAGPAGASSKDRAISMVEIIEEVASEEAG
jgi:hypothetical protein